MEATIKITDNGNGLPCTGDLVFDEATGTVYQIIGIAAPTIYSADLIGDDAEALEAYQDSGVNCDVVVVVVDE